MKAVACSVLILAAACGGAFGQSAPPQNQSFEVASVKVSKGTPQWKLAISGTRLTLTNYTLFGLLQEAYNLQDYEIEPAGASPLLLSGDTLYDIDAKAQGDGAPTRDDFRKMLQSLLADRFKLKVHRDMKEMPVYDLVTDRNGPKFKESTPDADPRMRIAAQGPNYLATMPKETMADLANTILRSVSGLPVLDKTGLRGVYDIRLTYGINPETNTEKISIFTAVQEQLGLRLVPQKSTIEILEVDHVESPSGN